MESIGRVLNPVALRTTFTSTCVMQWALLPRLPRVHFGCVHPHRSETAAGGNAQVLATIKRYWTSNVLARVDPEHSGVRIHGHH